VTCVPDRPDLRASATSTEDLPAAPNGGYFARPGGSSRLQPSRGLTAFNNLGTEWEPSEQTGIAMLMKGLFSTFRNPTAHAPKVLWATSRSEALDMLTLTSMLHRRLDEATVR